jgi:hypothetical protein
VKKFTKHFEIYRKFSKDTENLRKKVRPFHRCTINLYFFKW